MDFLNLLGLHNLNFLMVFLKIFKNKVTSFNFLIYSFLIWNSIKLFLINSEPLIQVLNLLISIGIYYIIEDQKLEIKNKKRFSFFIGVVFFSLVIIKSFLLNSVEDKYYYFNLPFGIFALIIILSPFKQFSNLRSIFIISLLLPLRRLFFSIGNYFLLPLTKYLTWFVLFALGKNPILNDKSLYIEGYQLLILKGCAGADNLFFVISAITIYMFIFQLKIKSNMLFMGVFSILISIFVNIFRNSTIGLVISSKNYYKDNIYHFLHNSYGSLLFSFISVTLVSLMYFKLLDKELNNE